MNTNDSPTDEAPQPSGQLQHTAAVAALTTAARDGYDMGEFICQVVTAAAANAGGVEALLSVRPESWEAAYVREIVLKTAGGDDGALNRYRTEPLRVVVNAESAFQDLRISDLFNEETRVFLDRHNAITAAAGDEFYVPHPDPARAKYGTRIEREDLTDDQRARLTEIWARADEVGESENELQALFDADQVAFGAAVAEQVRAIADERGLTVDILVRDPDLPWAYNEPYGEVDELVHEAEARSVLPQLGRTVGEIPEGGVVDAIRAAGRTYTERAAAGERAPHTDDEDQA